MRFDWKCKSSDVALPQSTQQKEVKVEKAIENLEEMKTISENSSNTHKPSIKVPKKEIKEGKKGTGSSSQMDIGVWNPDAIKSSSQTGNIVKT